MKKYSYSLNKFEKTLDITQFEHLLKYTLLIQLELFNLYGFIHKDLHLGNILVGKNKTKPINFYIHANRDPINFTSHVKLVLSDFEYSQILFSSINPNIFNFFADKNRINYDNCLEFNIMNTFYSFIDLIKDQVIFNKFKKIIYSYQVDRKFPVKILSSYVRKEIDQDRFKHYILSNCIDIIGQLYGKLFDGDFEFV